MIFSIKISVKNFFGTTEKELKNKQIRDKKLINVTFGTNKNQKYHYRYVGPGSEIILTPEQVEKLPHHWFP
jgi:cytochrome c oxidase assembly protein Cox11